MVYDNNFWIALFAVIAVIITNNCITKSMKLKHLKKGKYNNHDKNYA
jgi:hypothetical protein